MKIVLVLAAWILATGFPILGFAQATTTSSKDVELFVDKNEVAVVALSSDWCEPCREMERAMKSQEHGLPTLIYKVEDPKDFAIPRVSLPLKSVPTIVVFKKGTPIDLQISYTSTRGPEAQSVSRDLISRALNGTRSMETRTLPESLSDKAVLNIVRRSKVGSFVIPGRDFSGQKVIETNFGGSNLRDTKWKNSDLKAVIFSGADLTGADFAGAKLEGVFWGQCICPSGDSSSKFGYTCPMSSKSK